MSGALNSVTNAVGRMLTLPSGMNSVSDILGTGGAAAASASSAPPPTIPTAPADLTSPQSPQAPATIPTPDPTSASIQVAARRAAAQQMGTSGRAGTILTRMRSPTAPRTAPAAMADYSRSTLAAG